MKTGYYAAHTRALKEELGEAIERECLRSLHRKRPWRHFAVLARQCLLLAVCLLGIVRFRDTPFWMVFSALVGLTVFNFTVLLHEVLHGLVFARSHAGASRALELLYSIPSGISASQFTRWHLDHHAELGSPVGDPKRHHLSPKVNRRWYKALYFTPALFFIYFRAAARESATYPEDLRRRIALERGLATLFQLGTLSALWILAGFEYAAKLYLFPVFIVFPVAFALNRLGQHYDVRQQDPAQWSTLVKPSWFWDFAYLWSNYHLEHHYFPGVPFYNLPKLHQALRPFFARHNMVARGYGRLLFHYLVLNKAPHTDWELPPSPSPVL